MTINSEKKENALGTLTYDGKIYGIPYSTAGIGLVYNKTVLDKAVLPSDVWYEVGAYMCEYLAGSCDRQTLADNVDAYWQAQNE